MKQRLATWSQRPIIRITIALFCFAIAYGFVSWAIDSGSLIDYALAIAWLVAGINELVHGLRARTRRER